MYADELRALFAAAENARAAYREAEEEYSKATKIAFDTEFKNPDGTHALHLAAEGARLR